MLSSKLINILILLLFIVNVTFANDKLQEIKNLKTELIAAKGEKKAEILNNLINKYSYCDSLEFDT